MKSARGGFSLVEVVIAVAILAVVALAAMTAFSVLGRNSVRTSDASFATEKALQMTEELRAVSDAASVNRLDDYDDERKYGDDHRNYVLTTLKEVTDASTPDPGHPLSGNAGRKYYRKVLVRPVPGDESARQVTVRVHKDATGDTLAEVVTLLRSIKNQRPPTQVFDVYLLAIENAVGYWVNVDILRPTIENMITSLQNRNPGLLLRTHFITRLAYGRDPYYAPYYNLARRTDSLSSGDLLAAGPYYYPGYAVTDDPAGAATPYELSFYPLGNLTSRLNVDGVLQNVDPAFNYSPADAHNSAVRWPDELRMYQQHVTACRTASPPRPDPEPSWRMVLEDLNTDPGKYRNSIFINLHGAVLPLPPMRNYSDPAKDPRPLNAVPPGRPYVRAVTHPEQLEYENDGMGGTNGDPVRLRVYTFLAGDAAALNGPEHSTATVSVVLTNAGTAAGVSLGDITVYRLDGSTAAAAAHSWTALTSPFPAGVEVTVSGSHTKIVLRDSPLHQGHPSGGGTTGLDASKTLYGWQYIPSPPGGMSFPAPGASGPGRYDMADSTSNNPKNTARWVIQVAPNKLSASTRDRPYIIETVIGDNPQTGAQFNDPPIDTSKSNLSRTYFWVGPPGNVAPYTERFQFLGDPRHMPYADVKQAEGYNWFFQTDDQSGGHLPSSSGYLGYDNADNAWKGKDFLSAGTGASPTDIITDLPRLLGVLREGLMKTNSFCTHLAANFVSFYSLGGDIGIRQEGGYAGVLLHERFWNKGGNNNVTVHELKDSGPDIKGQRVIAATDGSWFGRWWLGELYPDAMYEPWSGVGAVEGNLPLDGNNAGDPSHFYRALYSAAGPNTYFNYKPYAPVLVADNQGAVSFLNGGATPTDPLRRAKSIGSPSGGPNPYGIFDLSLTAPGTAMAGTFRMALNPLLQVSNAFPMNIDLSYTGTAVPPKVPSEWAYALYSGSRTTVAVGEVYYNCTGSTGVSCTPATDNSSVFLRNWRAGAQGGQGTGKTAHIVLNILSPLGSSMSASQSSAYVAKMGLMTSLRAFMRAGEWSVAGVHNVQQLPFVEITSPTVYNDIKISATPSVTITWGSTWARWDSTSTAAGVPYTEAYTYTNGANDPLLGYNVKISSDGGKSWAFAAGGAAKYGVYDEANRVSSGTTWSATAAGPGVYVLRVEAFRRNTGTTPVSGYPHYSYQERDLYVSP